MVSEREFVNRENRRSLWCYCKLANMIGGRSDNCTCSVRQIKGKSKRPQRYKHVIVKMKPHRR